MLLNFVRVYLGGFQISWIYGLFVISVLSFKSSLNWIRFQTKKLSLASLDFSIVQCLEL